MKLIVVNESDAGQRFDKYLNKVMKDAGSSFIYKMLRKKNITLNNKKAEGKEHLKAGDEIRIFFSDETFEKFSGRSPLSSADAKSSDIIPGVSSGNAAARRSTSNSAAGTASKTGSQAASPNASGVSPVEDKLRKLSQDLHVIYEDDDVIFVNKPAGMLSQKAAAEDISLNEVILYYLFAKGKVNKKTIAMYKPSVCNRLDRNTSGIVTAAITYRGAKELSRLLKERSVVKTYLTVVGGKLEKPAHLKGWLTKDEEHNKVEILDHETEGASQIETEYIPVRSNGRLTLLKVHLITGKSHQIRSHLASIGHPVAGDSKYGEKELNDWYHRNYHGHFQLLHSWKLEVPKGVCELENIDGKSFTAGVPAYFKRILTGEGLLEEKN